MKKPSIEEVRKMLVRVPREERLTFVNGLLFPKTTEPCFACGTPQKQRGPAVITPEVAVQLLGELDQP